MTTHTRKARFAFADGGVCNDVTWVGLDRFKTGAETLFPVGLIEEIVNSCEAIASMGSEPA
jgi:hypothetical protein